MVLFFWLTNKLLYSNLKCYWKMLDEKLLLQLTSPSKAVKEAQSFFLWLRNYPSLASELTMKYNCYLYSTKHDLLLIKRNKKLTHCWYNYLTIWKHKIIAFHFFYVCICYLKRTFHTNLGGGQIFTFKYLQIFRRQQCWAYLQVMRNLYVMGGHPQRHELKNCHPCHVPFGWQSLFLWSGGNCGYSHLNNVLMFS